MIAIPCWMNIRHDPTFLERCARNGSSAVHGLLTFGSVTGVALGALYPVANYFIPPKAAGGGSDTSAKGELGNAVSASSSWLLTPRRPQPRSGPEGDPTYLIVEGEDAIGGSINAICSPRLCGALEQRRQQVHVPLPRQSVRRHREGGPRPGSSVLALANVSVVPDNVFVSQWTETDFRTGDKPWWA